jgi:transposase
VFGFVERDRLARWLDEGLSLREIGSHAGMHPGTVGYWVQRHGLAANGRARYSPKGGLERDALQRAVDAGMTQRELAVEFACSTSTIRYWLERHGLRTAGRRSAVRLEANGDAIGKCITHGATAFVLEKRGYYRCRRCRSEGVAARRRRVKEILVAEAGGCCRVCGYDRYPGALQFHHLHRGDKTFMLSRQGVTRSIAEAREEARKCILLCSNCHAEVEAGLVEVPAPA